MINTINIMLDELDVRELCLSVMGEYSKDKAIVDRLENNDIVVTVEREAYIDKIFGIEIQGKYYFARHQVILIEIPEIDYYHEFFFSNGKELDFGRYGEFGYCADENGNSYKNE
jgi:hypothetical protein